MEERQRRKGKERGREGERKEGWEGRRKGGRKEGGEKRGREGACSRQNALDIIHRNFSAKKMETSYLPSIFAVICPGGCTDELDLGEGMSLPCTAADSPLSRPPSEERAQSQRARQPRLAAGRKSCCGWEGGAPEGGRCVVISSPSVVTQADPTGRCRAVHPACSNPLPSLYALPAGIPTAAHALFKDMLSFCF